MNMVREPVNRLISQFYYLRSIKRWNGKKERPPKEWMEKDFDACVRSGDLECRVRYKTENYNKVTVLLYTCSKFLYEIASYYNKIDILGTLVPLKF